MGLVRNQLSMFSACASYDFQRLDYFDYLKMVLPPDAFENFFCGNIFDKTAFCLGERKVCS